MVWASAVVRWGRERQGNRRQARGVRIFVVPLPGVDPIHESAFEAWGLFGQLMYINRKEHLVVVVLSARPKPTGMNVIPDETFFGAVVKALR
ncbi:MAG TPA: hypothetical protein VMH03_02335 [Terriglobales bacterium]|nr:hypothetical protein [Terriglobales bacterium]